jgi:hypothetical protein
MPAIRPGMRAFRYRVEIARPNQQFLLHTLQLPVIYVTPRRSFSG